MLFLEKFTQSTDQLLAAKYMNKIQTVKILNCHLAICTF